MLNIIEILSHHITHRDDKKMTQSLGCITQIRYEFILGIDPSLFLAKTDLCVSHRPFTFETRVYAAPE